MPTVRNHPEALNPQLKTLNYLNNILAKIEATNAGVDEAILLNSQGYVTECTGGPGNLTEADLARDYRSQVDPRLNYEQAMEIAFLIAEQMK